jgi:hypothetical protein
MNFSEDELELFRQWFNAVEDLNPKYLERKDYLLAKKVLDELGARAPNSMLEKLEKLSS